MPKSLRMLFSGFSAIVGLWGMDATIVEEALGGETLYATRVADGLSRPIFATSPPGDTERLFIAEQHSGRIQILDLTSNTTRPTPFLDLNGLATSNEQGLLGMAFHPNYTDNGLFYLNFTDSSGQTNVVSYRVSDGDPYRADEASRQTLMQFRQPESNHNGGWIGFGPNDGYLYVASGDGGGGNDQHGNIGNGQNLTTLLGKMLRIDVDGDDFPTDTNRNYAVPPTNPFVAANGEDEIWAYGLRNPWRASFDRKTGDLYIGDVGQGRLEEVNFQPANSPGGENYGWRLREGTIATPGGVGGPIPPGAVDPIFAYPHDESGGFSISGGYVYRGPLDELHGQYFFADYVSNNIWSLEHDGTQATNVINRNGIVTDQGSIESISSFGEDGIGNLYLLSLNGDVFRLDDVVQTIDLVAAGSEWRYLDDGSDQGTAWANSDFDDSNWKLGPAQLGYGDGDESTVIEFGPNSNDKYITTYFRHEFNVEDLAGLNRLQLGFLRDDGGAVYLNGVEIARSSNLAPDAGFDTPADFGNAASTAGGDEVTFFPYEVDPNTLVPGRNVLAVEIHQFNATSSDVSFDLRLSAILPSEIPLACDFNSDHVCDIGDVDLLTATANLVVGTIVTAETDHFDLDNSGVIDAEDLTAWLRTAGAENGYASPLLRGDANLDGNVNASDLNVLGVNWQQATSKWSQGDFDGDGFANAADLNQLGINWQRAAAPIAASVPEPAMHLFAPIFLAGALLVLRRGKLS